MNQISILIGVLFSLCSVYGTELKFGANGSFALSDRHGSLFVRSASGGARIMPLNGELTARGGVLQGDGFRWKLEVERRERLFSIQSTLINTSGRQLLLEPGMELTVPRSGHDLFWGGFDVQKATDAPLARRGFKGRTTKHVGGGLNQPFPTAALLGGGKAFILGQKQFELTSYNAAEYKPLGANRAELQFSQRVVLEAGQSVRLHFALGIVPVRFDREENVVQAFYDAFPENWRPFVGQENPYIWGAHSQYRAWYFKPSREQERRYFATIDWAYTPYKRSGDCYGRPELWNYVPIIGPFKIGFAQHANGQVFDYRTLTPEEFHAKRKDIFRRDGRDFGYSFYVCAGWCELNLAKEKYADSLTEDTDVPLILGPWSTHHDRERRVFPGGNSFAKVFREDLKRVAEELDLPGFAFDCGTPGVNHRGAAAHNPDMPGRAWDEKGIFVDELCAVIKLIDYVHKMRPADPLYVWKNGQGPADYMMIETDLFSPTFKSWMPLTRYNIGQRPAVLHVVDGFMFNFTIPDWRNLSKDEFMRRWARLGDYVVLSDFEYGMTQTHNAQNGNPQSLYCMPELLECIRNGWQALVPVAVNNQGRLLQRARYGRGANTILYYGNPWDEPMPLEFRVDNSALGQGYALFVPKMRDRAKLVTKLERGDSCFTAILPSRRPALFEAVCSLSRLPDSGNLSATVESCKDSNRIVYSIMLDNEAPFRSAILPRWIYRFTPSITVNGKQVAAGGETLLPAGAKINIVFDSKFFRSSGREILAFPFTDTAKRPSFIIHLPDKPNGAEYKAAANLQEYFRFTADKGITIAKTINISEGDSAAALPAVEIRVGRGVPSEIMIAGERLLFSAADAGEAAEMMKQLNYLMDRRYPYFFPAAHPNNSFSAELIRKFELFRNLLPWSRCFETETKL